MSHHDLEAGSRQAVDLGLDVGLGSPPRGPVIVGGVFRLQPHFGYATDFGLSLRTTTAGYTEGGWGAALDLGGYLRAGQPSQGLLGSIVFGAPWGLVLSATGSYGTDEARGLCALLGVDFARLTVYRRTGASWWKNPFPAGADERRP